MESEDLVAESPEVRDGEPGGSLARRLAEVAWAFLPLGWIAFGGPQAHIALLQERFVERRRWLDEQRFVELLGLGQGLPGPTSTQMVVAVGTARAGPLGGLLAFLLFLYPAATIMALAGLGVATFLDEGRPPGLAGRGAGGDGGAGGGGGLAAGDGGYQDKVDDGADAAGGGGNDSGAAAVGFSGRRWPWAAW